ncbi:MAG: hypothetical protein WBX15_04290 [Thermoanaerobaculia bacterium]
MMRPSVREERSWSLIDAMRSWRKAGLVTPEEELAARGARASGWKRSGPVARIVLMIFAAICVASFYGILDLAQMPGRGVVVALAAVGVAEFLIRGKRLFHTGFDEGLYIAGLFAFIIGLGGPPRDEGLLLFALASLIAGVRTLNGFFVTGSSIFVIAYVGVKLDSGIAAGWLALLFVLLALVLDRIPFNRPTHQDVVSLHLLVFPPLAWFLFLFGRNGPDSMPFIWMLLFPLFAAALLGAGLHFRRHPQLLAGMILFALWAFELSTQMKWRGDLAAIGWGVTGLAAAMGAERVLRHEHGGITSRQLAAGELDLVELAAIIPVVPRAATPAPASGPQLDSSSDGGSFGGAGASGEY